MGIQFFESRSITARRLKSDYEGQNVLVEGFIEQVDGCGVTLESNRKQIKHPASGIIMPGLKIPNWEEVIKTVTKAAMKMERIGYIGWDVAVTENGCELIEENINYPGTNIIQMDGFECYGKLQKFLSSK